MSIAPVLIIATMLSVFTFSSEAVAGSLRPFIDSAKIPARGTTAFTNERVLPTTEEAHVSDIGAFRTVCDYSHMAFDDPIVYPGQPGKSHLHVFFGNTLTDANSSSASIASVGASTCRGGIVNRTAYWIPAMIDTIDSAPVLPPDLGVYYKTGYLGVRPSEVRPFPVGLRIIAGDASAITNTGGPGSFNCELANGGSSGWVKGIPDCKAGTRLEYSLEFPQCWDGVNLDSPDHKGHMAYAHNGCPADHPVALPQITFNVGYTVPARPHATTHWRLASDNYPASAPGGYSIHGDWINGWKPAILDAWVRGCDNASKDCHSHLLGNGKMIF